MRIGCGHRAVAGDDPLVEVVAGPFEAVELAAVQAGGEHVSGSVEQHDVGRPQSIDRPVVDPPQVVDVEPPPVALVGERRVHAAVADDVPPGVERRPHDPGEVLGPVGRGDQRFGTVGEVGDVVVVEDRPQPFTDGRAAGLAGQHGADRRGQPRRLGALPAPLGALQRHVPDGVTRQCQVERAALRAGRLAAAFFGRRLLGRLLGRGAALGGDLLAADRQQLERPLGDHLLDAVALADRGVGLAVGDVHAEPAVAGDDGSLAHRVGAELAAAGPSPPCSGRRGGTPSAAAKIRNASSSVTVNSSLLVLEVAEVAALLDVRPVAAVVGDDRLAVGGVRAERARQAAAAPRPRPS